MVTQGEDVEVHALAQRGWTISAIARHHRALGVGKTMLAVALARAAVEAGYRDYCATAAELAVWSSAQEAKLGRPIQGSSAGEFR